MANLIRVQTKGMAQFACYVPPALLAAFKRAVLARGITVRQAVAEAFALWLREES